ncbi:unnamed protein product [Rhizoctonia solani]|uniref:F-box domain-containing protein n=1 Tax=Rhizoctonia solani TaxID=456999 RepID=A0A8H2XPN2_9AGAM|nr:unnamed protein product [Rhizoctonia solani]
MHDTGTFMLGSLSPELIIKILHHCQCSTIFRFAATCKTYHELVAQTTSLQLHIELEANGLELVKGSFKEYATYSVILDDLKRFRDAWLNLDFKEPIVRPVIKSEMLLWELREGFYIVAFSQSGGSDADALQFVPIDVEIPTPPPLLFDFTFSEFTADPGQGLVATISGDPDSTHKCHVDLRSAVTGLAHPLAEYPRLTVEVDFESPPFSSGYSIEIMGHMVLVKVSHPRVHIYELLIWDWRSGILLQRISSREGMCDFAFLDQRHLVVLSATRSDLNRETLALLVYATPQNASALHTSPGKQWRIVDFPFSRPILRLEFPRLKESSEITERGFFLRSDPTPGRTIYAKSAAFACPYATTLSMTFCFHRTSANWGVSPFYRVFVDGQSLLKHIYANSRDETQVIPWSVWGTDATRWFTAPEAPDHWICWMSGSKYVRPLHDISHYCVFDFSPLVAGRFQGRNVQSHPAALDVHSSGGPDIGDIGLLEYLDSCLLDFVADSPDHKPVIVTVGADSPSTINTGKLDGVGFDEPIISRLPYRVVCKGNNEEDHEGWQINRDGIIGVASWRPQSETITIHKLNI